MPRPTNPKTVKPPAPRVPITPECAVYGCTKRVRAKGLCGGHYNAAREGRELHFKQD